jgi:hypothetical protein
MNRNTITGFIECIFINFYFWLYDHQDKSDTYAI